MYKKKTEQVAHKCVVRLFDDSDVLDYEFLEKHKGDYLIDQLCKQLNIKEKDYFGLRFIDSAKQRQWLDLGKPIIKQCKEPIIFTFRVKFYPANPFRLNANVRILLYKQLKRDLSHGRLYCSCDEIVMLGVLIVQEKFGDYNEGMHTDDYVSNIQFSARQTDTIEKKIIARHKERKPGQDPLAVINEFLGIACRLEAYGIEPHCVKDHNGTQMYIGINFFGVSTFIAGKRSQHFRWSEIRKLSFEGRMFIAHLSYTDASREVKKYTIGFKCATGAACRYLWRCAIEHMLFFTLPNCRNARVKYRGGIFSRGAKFKYTGRTEREILSEVIHSSSFPSEDNKLAADKKSNSVPVTPSSPNGASTHIRYNSLPRTGIPCADTDTYDLNHFLMDFTDVPEMENDYVIPTQLLRNFCSNEAQTEFTHDKAMIPLPTSIPHNASSFSNVLTKSAMNTNTDRSYKAMNRKNLRKFRILRYFFPSLVFVILFMILLAFTIFESKIEIFNFIRNAPEIIILRDEYYEPLKKMFSKVVIYN
ncbi:FERM domain-containing protein 5 [Ceratitis capitata]|uniref:FERM domain-containing protein 5 n=1 Tax=Ceratitis capitata TaxID=7213 RepID=UPI00032A23F2|nr:FERM domain-containing protein 5 [Ceratitis capitata]